LTVGIFTETVLEGFEASPTWRRRYTSGFVWQPTRTFAPGAGRRGALVALGLAAAMLVPRLGWAESELRLPAPSVFGDVAAGTYNEEGDRVGPAMMRTQKLADGRVRLSVESGFAGAERTLARAELAPLEDGATLRILSQESRSFNEDGDPLGVLFIDHVKRMASCTPAPDSENEIKRFQLPSVDRVANVPLTLLFRRLVSGETNHVKFQIFACLGGPRLLDARASLASRENDVNGATPNLVEVHYNVDLGPVLTSFVRPFVPRMSIWFDPQNPDPWVGYRVPLYGRGPTVLVVRSGFSPNLFTEDP
jgi:hypothetical protein